MMGWKQIVASAAWWIVDVWPWVAAGVITGLLLSLAIGRCSYLDATGRGGDPPAHGATAGGAP